MNTVDLKPFPCSFSIIPMPTKWETKAFNFARLKHSDQKDDSGKNYFESHIMQVVAILKEVTYDKTIISAAYLHDTIEDTNTTIDEIYDLFGPEISEIVFAVTHDGNKKDGCYFPRLEGGIKNEKAILVKFADRLSNLSRMKCWPEERRNRYLKKSVFWKLNK